MHGGRMDTLMGLMYYFGESPQAVTIDSSEESLNM